MRRSFVLLLAVISCGWHVQGVHAQDVSESMRSDIVELMSLTGGLELGEQVGNALSEQIINTLRTRQPDTPQRAFDIVVEVTKDHMNRFINDPATIDGFVNLYARHFTQDEIREIITFYKSPAGAKLAAETPQLAAESMQFAQSRMAAVVPAMQQELAQRLQAENLMPGQQQAE